MSLRLLILPVCLALASSCASTPEALGILDRNLIQSGRPDNAKAYSDFLIARYAAMTNDPQIAAAHYAAAIDSAPEKSGIADRALFAALLSGNYDEGVKLAHRADELGSDAALVRLTLGVDAMRRGKDATAQEMLDETRFGPFNRVVARGLSAWRVVDRQGPAAAVRYLNDGLTGDPRLDSATLYMMGLVQLSAEQDDAALATFETLWQSGARLAVGVEAHARLLANRGRRAEALGLLSTFRSEVGTNASLDRLRTAIEAGDTIKIRRLKPSQGAALAVYIPAAALMTQTEDDVSAVYFVLALALDPDLHVARSLWGQTLDNAGRHEEAIAVLARVPENSAFYATSRGQIAWALRHGGRNQAALSVAAEALKHQPDRALKVQLADLYRSLDRYGEANSILTQIIDEDAEAGRQDWRLLFARGLAREEMGRWPEAEMDMVEAMALNPNDAALLNALGYAYVDRGRNLDTAIDMIRKAAEIEPDSGFILDSLGWAHYRLGRYEMAVRYLERAVELEPGDPVLNDHLGDAYWRTGRKLEARFQWQNSLRLDPSMADRERIEVKLVSGPDIPSVKRAESGSNGLPIPQQP
ncbi:MAG: tetratricopeptide repeat protein [Alphaproteobacteria bacterium]|nr:tetratricopeptide repeat protein [Alphaproteobacteria bacterium]